MQSFLKRCIVAALARVAYRRGWAAGAHEAEGDAVAIPHDTTADPEPVPRGYYELTAEGLQRDITEASVRNKAALDASKRQAREVLSFEERSRDTLRALMIDMGHGDDDSCR